MIIRWTSCYCYHLIDEKMEAVRVTASWASIACALSAWSRVCPEKSRSPRLAQGVGQGTSELPSLEGPTHWSRLPSFRAVAFSCCRPPFPISIFFGKTFPLSGYQLGFFWVGVEVLAVTPLRGPHPPAASRCYWEDERNDPESHCTQTVLNKGGG